ncbi:MAG: nucleotidyltransferase domain-containing protein [DPANN group archaeon]|nr:nucleotidyltransferase domain-containing protein [DPANN group archaeon]
MSISTALKILRFFLENPYKEIHLRELSRTLKISPFAIKKYADMLLANNQIVERKQANLRMFRANNSNPAYRHLKIAENLQNIQESGLVPYLKETVPAVTSMVLFGSVATGTDDRQSDIDLVIIGKKTKTDLSSFEKKLGKPINHHIFSWAEWKKKQKQDRAFYQDVIINGIPLEGELPLVKER